MSSTYKATVTELSTKTGLNYFWLLPKDSDKIIRLILKHEDTGFGSYKYLYRTLLTYY